MGFRATNRTGRKDRIRSIAATGTGGQSPGRCASTCGCAPRGPVKAKYRFDQVPHCNGGGYRDPSAAAEMRAIKVEGGWGVIFTGLAAE